VIVDCAIYRDGRREGGRASAAEASAACGTDGRIVWIGLYEPSVEEFEEVTREFALHELAVEDAIHAHQRPKLERYGEMLFLVLKPARYIDDTETVEFGEVHVFAAPAFVVAVRHRPASALHRVRERLESRPELLRRGTGAIVHAILDRVVDDYAPVVAGIENDIDEIENELFGTGGDVSRRIYELTREVIDFQRASKPLLGILERLMQEPDIDDEERRYLRDVLDHAIRVQEQVDGFRDLLANILSVNLTRETKSLSEVAISQNEELKKISGWAAILFAPTLVGTIYGMNFEHMPELGWMFGYPFAIALMGAVCLSLYVMFKRREWI
jgi:magnesium transporter